MNQKVYISGPMTGYEKWNYPAFDNAAKNLRDKGYIVLSPSETGMMGEPREKCMRRSLQLLLKCDLIYLLEGWEKSRGATLEKKVADEVGINVLEL